MSELAKQIEEGRAARRERARAKVAAGWTPPAPEKPAPKRRKVTMTFAQVDRAVARHRKECDAWIDEAARDSGLTPDEIWCDIVRSYALTTQWKLPIVRAEFLRGYGLSPKDVM